MKLKLLSIVFVVFSFFISRSQTQQDWEYLPYQFNSANYGAVHAVSASEVFVVIQGEVYKSLDGGLTWNTYDTQIQKAFYDIAFADSNIGYAVGDEASLIKTNNGGTSWTPVSLATTQDLFSVSVTSNGNVYAVGENGTLITSLDNGSTWVESSSLTSEVLNTVKFRNDNEGFIVGNNGSFFHTTNGGQTWQPINLITNEDFFSLTLDATNVYFLSGEAGSISGNDFTVERLGYEVYKSNDLINWEQEAISTSQSLASSISVQDNTMYQIFGQFMLCDCCVIEISRQNYTTNVQEYFVSDELASSGPYCDFNFDYFDLSVYNDQTAFALSGSHLLKMDYAGTASVKDFNKSTVSIYPNPAENKQFLITSNALAMEELEFKLYNFSGKMVKELNNVQEKNLIHVPNLPAGIYFLKVKRQHQDVGVKKLILK